MTTIAEGEPGRRDNLALAFARNWWGAVRDGGRAALALPLMALLMIGVEFAQHVVEVKIGFFSADLATRKAVAFDPVRMAFGWPKMIMVWALGFFAVRYLLLGDARAAMRPPAAALRRYAPVVLFQLIPFIAILYAQQIVAPFGGGENAVMALRGVFGLGQQLLEPALCLWFASAALGEQRWGPVGSARTTGWLYLWALPLIFLARIPLNAAHQLLNRYAAGQPEAVLWGMLAVDALVVVGLVTVVAAAFVRVARFVTLRRDVALG